MFETIDLEKNVDSIISTLERNAETARNIRKQVRELEQQPKEIKLNPKEEKRKHVFAEEEIISKGGEVDEEMKSYIDEYRRISGDDEETIIALLPDPDDYRYSETIYRLHAESLREIKEMMDLMGEEENSEDECQDFITNERKKITILQNLLAKEEKKEEQQKEKNTIILAPTESGRIRILDDIDSLPPDFYEAVYTTIQSIIDGSFKRLKRFNLCRSATIGTVYEVRMNMVRVIFQRVNKDTYAIVSTFLKKIANDRGYQKYMENILYEYGKVEARLKANLQNPEFIASNAENVQEMWDKLGHGEAAKVYGKGGK